MESTGSYSLLSFLLAISLLFFGLRMYVRIIVVKQPALDDILLGIGVLLFFYLAFTAFACALISHGLAIEIDQDTTELDEWSAGTFFFLVSELTFVMCSAMIRLAFAVQMLRVLLPQRHRALRLCIYITTSFMVLYSIAFSLVILFGCQPVDYYWKYMYPGTEGGCIGGEHLTGKYDIMAALLAAHSIICVLSDWILGAMPFFMLKGVQMSAPKKAVVVFLMSLGVLAGVAAVIRARFLGTVAICAATLMPLFKRLTRKAVGGTLRKSGSHCHHHHHHQRHQCGGGGGGGGVSGRKSGIGAQAASHGMRPFKTMVRAGRPVTTTTESLADMPFSNNSNNVGGAVIVETSWIVEEDSIIGRNS